MCFTFVPLGVPALASAFFCSRFNRKTPLGRCRHLKNFTIFFEVVMAVFMNGRLNGAQPSWACQEHGTITFARNLVSCLMIVRAFRITEGLSEVPPTLL